MYPESDHVTIEDAIRDFAEAYDALEKLQDLGSEKDGRELLLPLRGDQKTGLIGEYWAMRYARSVAFRGLKITFGGHSEKGWDLNVKTENSPDLHRIQVKTASLFSKERKLTPIHPPSDHWHELWLILLDKNLQPVGFWETSAAAFERARRSSIRKKDDTHLKQLKKIQLPDSASGAIRPAWLNEIAANHINEFREAVGLLRLHLES